LTPASSVKTAAGAAAFITGQDYHKQARSRLAIQAYTPWRLKIDDFGVGAGGRCGVTSNLTPGTGNGTSL